MSRNQTSLALRKSNTPWHAQLLNRRGKTKANACSICFLQEMVRGGFRVRSSNTEAFAKPLKRDGYARQHRMSSLPASLLNSTGRQKTDNVVHWKHDATRHENSWGGLRSSILSAWQKETTNTAVHMSISEYTWYCIAVLHLLFQPVHGLLLLAAGRSGLVRKVVSRGINLQDVFRRQSRQQQRDCQLRSARTHPRGWKDSKKKQGYLQNKRARAFPICTAAIARGRSVQTVHTGGSGSTRSGWAWHTTTTTSTRHCLLINQNSVSFRTQKQEDH